jgi:dipeptidyl aminopeptidase/acylaminoacyl peptidase
MDTNFLISEKVTSAKNFEIIDYEKLPPFLTERISKDIYSNIKKRYQSEFKNRTFEINYRSNQLDVLGLVLTPPNFDINKKYPIIIFNRGGNRELGQHFFVERHMKSYADYGYLVFLPQYRGVGGGEGKDEFGGADLEDVLSLLSIAKCYPFTDSQNSFMIGESRGGMMTYLALKDGANVQAAVSLYGLSDMFLTAKNRPEMVTEVFNELIPDINNNREQAYNDRSACLWADKINTPLLILHGDVDQRVSHAHSIKLSDELKKYNKTHKLKIYPGEDHGLNGVNGDMVKEIHDWLNLYRKKHKELLSD